MKRLGLLCVFLLTACPDTGVVCRAGTDRCGNGCADLQTDSRNCGACGQACLGTQVCVAGGCQCRSGTSLCSGQCVVVESDPKHCGRCGNACPAGNFCEAGSCRSGTCSGTLCADGGSCVNAMTDPMNCGACGNSCPAPQSCHAGACQWDLVAACFSTGQLVGVQSGSDQRGPLNPFGSGPASLAQYGQKVLAVDGIDSRLIQASLPELQQLSEFNDTGRYPNQVFVDPPYVYSVNSGTHTLQILAPVGDAGCPAVMQPDAGCAYVSLADGGSVAPAAADGGCFYPQTRAADAGCADTQLGDGGVGPFPLDDGGCFAPPPPPPPPDMPCFQQGSDAGLKLVTIGELDTGANSFPEAVAKAGGALWVALNGPGDVIKVNVSNPRNPQLVGTVHLSGLDLKSFDGGPTAPGPFWIAEHGGKLYVPLNNLNFNFQPGGPGMLAVIDPATMDAGTIDLGPASCLNALFVASAQGKLFVSCGGFAIYSMPDYALVSTDKAGVVMLDPATNARATWSPQCPPGGDGGCSPILPSRLAVRDGRIYLGDQNGGRIFVADILGDGGIKERRGYAAGAMGAPVQACGVAPFGGPSNVSDIISLP